MSVSPPAGTRSPAPGNVHQHHGGSMSLSGPATGVPNNMNMGNMPMSVNMPFSSAIPTAAELEAHYHELSQERRRITDMLEKTERMMERVRRGMEEQRASEQRQPLAVPLSGARGEGRRESIWPVVSSESAARE